MKKRIVEGDFEVTEYKVMFRGADMFKCHSRFYDEESAVARAKELTDRGMEVRIDKKKKMFSEVKRELHRT